jgi:hypothetical protein
MKWVIGGRQSTFSAHVVDAPKKVSAKRLMRCEEKFGIYFGASGLGLSHNW